MRLTVIASHVVIAACVLVGCPVPVFGEITRLEGTVDSRGERREIVRLCRSV